MFFFHWIPSKYQFGGDVLVTSPELFINRSNEFIIEPLLEEIEDATHALRLIWSSLTSNLMSIVEATISVSQFQAY